MPIIAFTCLIITLLLSGSAGATTIISTFDTDLDGWTTNPQGTLAFQATGGNPGGFLEETDASSTGNMHIDAPGKFLGDLTGADLFSVDILTYSTPANLRPAFGTLTFLNSVAALSITLDLGDPGTGWTNYSTALNPTAFGVGAATYASVMGNVTGITLILETDKNSDTEQVGVDNVTISGSLGASAVETPEPEYFGLLGIALTLGGLARRRKNA